MIDRAYLERRAADEAELASRATNSNAAAAHKAMAAAYLKELARLAEQEERRLRLERLRRF